MKAIFLSFFLFTFIGISGAQVSEMARQMSLGVHNGFRVAIPGASPKLIGQVWKKYTKEYGKLKKNKKADEEYIEAAVIKSIFGSNPMDIYTSIEEGYITAFFDLKTGFLSSSSQPGESMAAKNFMQEFGYEVQREQTRQELSDQEDTLKKAEKNLDKLKKDHQGYHKDIDDAKERIKKAEANIVTNEKDQEQARQDIDTQKKKVEEVRIKLDNIGKSK